MKIRGWHPLVVLALFLGGRSAADDKPAVTPLRQAHAHNDYEHTRPLFDALDHGFCSVEADVFLVGGKLLVGHNLIDLRPARTLEALYLDPLRARARANGGRIYPGGPTLYLLIDVKSEAKATFAALVELLARYDDILSCARDGKNETRAVTVVISGNRDRDGILAQKECRAGVDGRPEDLDSELPTAALPWISARWGALFHWQGDGPFPAAEHAQLRDYVRKAHARGRLVRFWATPESPVVWEELLAAGVDLINTDRLAELRRFLTKR
jgi:hypothetical protein